MKIYHLEKIIPSSGYSFVVENEEKLLFEVDSSSFNTNLNKTVGNIIGLPFDMTVLDCTTRKVTTIKRLFSVVFNKYLVVSSAEKIASIRTQRTLGVPKVYVESIYGDFEIKTNTFADNFEVKSDGQIAASIIKEKRKINDQYEIVNYEIEDDLFMVSLACDYCHSFVPLVPSFLPPFAKDCTTYCQGMYHLKQHPITTPF